MTPEGIIKAHVKKVLARYKDCIYYRMHVPSGYGKQTLDYEGAAAGRSFAIETKAPNKTITDRQDQTIEEMLAGGVTVFVIDGDDGCNLLDRWLGATTRQTGRAP